MSYIKLDVGELNTNLFIKDFREAFNLQREIQNWLNVNYVIKRFMLPDKVLKLQDDLSEHFYYYYSPVFKDHNFYAYKEIPEFYTEYKYLIDYCKDGVIYADARFLKTRKEVHDIAILKPKLKELYEKYNIGE